MRPIEEIRKAVFDSKNWCAQDVTVLADAIDELERLRAQDQDLRSELAENEKGAARALVDMLRLHKRAEAAEAQLAKAREALELVHQFNDRGEAWKSGQVLAMREAVTAALSSTPPLETSKGETAPPWECPRCLGDGYTNTPSERCDMCAGKGTLPAPKPIEPRYTMEDVERAIRQAKYDVGKSPSFRESAEAIRDALSRARTETDKTEAEAYSLSNFLLTKS